MRTVELLPDPGFEAAVRRAWDRLHAAGLPSLATHRHPTNRPHLTLAEADALDGPVLAEVAALVAPVLPVPISAAALGMFVHRGVVLHLAVVASPALVVLHERVLELLAARGCRPRSHVQPGDWMPHVTLASRLPREQLPAAVAAVGDALPVVGTWVAARSYDTTTRRVTDLTDPASMVTGR